MTDRMTELGRTSGDAAAMMVSTFATGYLRFHEGEIRTSFEPLEEAVRLSQDLDDQSMIEAFHVHPGVLSLSCLAVGWSLAGDQGHAERWREETLSFVDRLDHPFSQVVGLVNIGMADCLWRDVERLLCGAETAVALATQLGYHHYELFARVLYGSAIAQQGRPETGIAEMEQALAAIYDDGWLLQRPFFLTRLAEARQQCGRLDSALVAVDEAVRVAEVTEERFSLAELYRLRGELMLEVHPERREEALQWLRRAVEVGESQGARLLERRAAASLAKAEPTELRTNGKTRST